MALKMAVKIRPTGSPFMADGCEDTSDQKEG